MKNENKNVENNDKQNEEKQVKAHRGGKRQRKPEPFNPIKAVGDFVCENKKWFIIGGCIIGGLALGGAGTMMVNKDKQMKAAKAQDQELKDLEAMERYDVE